MANKKKKRKKKSKKKIIRNPFQPIAMNQSGSGYHKDKRTKRTDKNSWKNEEMDS